MPFNDTENVPLKYPSYKGVNGNHVSHLRVASAREGVSRDGGIRHADFQRSVRARGGITLFGKATLLLLPWVH